jgi:pantothenate synthetase
LQLCQMAAEMLPSYPLIHPDYFEIRRAGDLGLVETLRAQDRPIALVAAFCGNTRLIDNMPLLDWDR